MRSHWLLSVETSPPASGDPSRCRFCPLTFHSKPRSFLRALIIRRYYYEDFFVDFSAPRKLGILLALPPTDRSATVVHGLAQAACEAGHEVYLYLIDEGVKNLNSPPYRDLATSGVRMFACAYGCQQHHVSTADLDSSISLSGLVVLSGLIDACEPFLSFT
jgi:predicted peroxiredoxin